MSYLGGYDTEVVDQYFQHLLLFHSNDLIRKLQSRDRYKNFILVCKNIPIADYLIRLLFKLIDLTEQIGASIGSVALAECHLFFLFRTLIDIGSPKKETLFLTMRYYMAKCRPSYKVHRQYTNRYDCEMMILIQLMDSSKETRFYLQGSAQWPIKVAFQIENYEIMRQLIIRGADTTQMQWKRQSCILPPARAIIFWWNEGIPMESLRDDIMENRDEYDNQDFIEELEDGGFLSELETGYTEVNGIVYAHPFDLSIEKLKRMIRLRKEGKDYLSNLQKERLSDVLTMDCEEFEFLTFQSAFQPWDDKQPYWDE
jgi:hypothetical protein